MKLSRSVNTRWCYRRPVNFDTVLVTGGAGRLGREVVAALTPHCRVRVLDRATDAAVPVDAAADVLDVAALATAMRGCDAIVHLAAIDSSVPAPASVVFDTNVRGTWNVLHVAKEAGARRVIVTSSVAAAGLDYTNPRMAPLYLPIDEAHPLRPSQPYGLSKQLNEDMAASFARAGGIEVICLRPAWVMFPEAVRRVKAERDGGDVPVVAGRRREPWPLLRAYVSPDDAARAFVLALELRDVRQEVFVITAADTFEASPTVEHIAKTYGVSPDVRRPELYASNPRASAWDITHARDVLGWTPSRTWEDFAARF